MHPLQKNPRSAPAKSDELFGLALGSQKLLTRDHKTEDQDQSLIKEYTVYYICFFPLSNSAVFDCLAYSFPSMSLLQSVQPQIQFLYSMNHNKKIKSNLN